MKRFKFILFILAAFLILPLQASPVLAAGAQENVNVSSGSETFNFDDINATYDALSVTVDGATSEAIVNAKNLKSTSAGDALSIKLLNGGKLSINADLINSGGHGIRFSTGTDSSTYSGITSSAEVHTGNITANSFGL